MEEKLINLYNVCIEELKTIGIDVINNKGIGTIDIRMANRNAKRYGCCRQEEPDKDTKYIEKRGYKRIIKYANFKKHHIEISRWVLELNDSIIKNTIMHEIIHCFPGCNNHGADFKKYAKYINQNLGYDITTVGNKKTDYINSNLQYNEKEEYKYKIFCKNCGQIFYRKRFNKKLIKNYRCKCGGKLHYCNIIK